MMQGGVQKGGIHSKYVVVGVSGKPRNRSNPMALFCWENETTPFDYKTEFNQCRSGSGEGPVWKIPFLS